MTVNRLKKPEGFPDSDEVSSNPTVPGSILPTPHFNTGLWKVNDSFKNKGNGGRVPG